MARLSTKVKGRVVTVELSIDELQELLQRQLFPRQTRSRTHRAVAGGPDGSKETAAQASVDLADAIKRAWPDGMELVRKPELTTGNVRRYLIQRVLSGELTTSTGEVARRFFGRGLSPMDPDDATNLRRLWYSIREAKRDIEQAVGGRWIEATDAPVRAGTSRAWRFVPSQEQSETPPILAYRGGQ